MIHFILLVSLFVIGVWASTQEAQPFSFIGKWYNGLPEGVLKFIFTPVIGCPVCMASVWTIAGSFYYFPVGLEMIWQIPINILAVYGINMFIMNQWND